MKSKMVKWLSAFAVLIMFAGTALFGQTGTAAAEATSWRISTIDMVGDVGEFTSLGLDSNDKVHISYYDSTNGNLKYATNALGPWVTCTIDKGKTVGLFTSLALDSSNKVHISYYDKKAGDLKYATNADGSWVALTIDSKGDVGSRTSIAVDSGDKVHISYLDLTKVDLKYATNAGGSWTTCTVDSAGMVGLRGTSIAIDSGDKVHISYIEFLDPLDQSQHLKYATNAEGSWMISEIDAPWPGIGEFSSLALDSSGKVHISCGDGAGNLWYATNSGGSWTICELDHCWANHATYTSLAIDSLDKVHISYVNRYDDIGYATNAGGSWAISTVDIDGTTSSIAIDSSDRVHISYVDGTKWDLKYARNAEPPPVTLVIYNGTVITMEEDMPVAQAIAIKDDRIVAVGTNEDVLALVEAGTRVIDLQGRTVLPGFIDSHSHWINNFDLAGLGTPYETGQRWLPPWTAWSRDRDAKGVTVQDSIQAALKGGWTSISEMFAWQGCLDEIIALDQAGELGVRVNAYLPLSYEFQRFGDWYQAYGPGQEFSSKVRIGGVKIFADSSDYGQSVYFSQDELTALVSKAHEEGYQIAIHACDAGIDLVLNAFEEALQGEPNAVYRHRVEHLSVLRDDQLDRMAQLGLIASFQFTFFTSNPWDIYEVQDYIGFDRADLVGRSCDILAAGIPSIGSTDYPWFFGVNGSAMASIYKAVTRIGEPASKPSPQWLLDQRITVEQALRLLTIDAAYGTFQEDVKGSIAAGKFADLVVLSENPLAVPEERLMDAYVLMTMVGGQVEYCAPGHEYLYGSVYSEAPDTSYLGTSSNAFLQTPTEELLVTSEAVTSYKESA